MYDIHCGVISGFILWGHVRVYIVGSRQGLYCGVRGHVKVYIFKQQISNDPTETFGIKTKYTPRPVFQLVNSTTCQTVLHIIGRSKMNLIE